MYEPSMRQFIITLIFQKKENICETDRPPDPPHAPESDVLNPALG